MKKPPSNSEVFLKHGQRYVSFSLEYVTSLSIEKNKIGLAMYCYICSKPWGFRFDPDEMVTELNTSLNLIKAGNKQLKARGLAYYDRKGTGRGSKWHYAIHPEQIVSIKRKLEDGRKARKLDKAKRRKGGMKQKKQELCNDQSAKSACWSEHDDFGPVTPVAVEYEDICL